MKFKLIFGICILFILSSSLVLGLGITPAKKIISYEPGLNFEGSFKVVNTENRPINIVLGKTGAMATYVNFEETSFNVKELSEKSIRYFLNLPEGYPQGMVEGRNEINLIVKELNGIEENKVSASVSLTTQLILEVPYSEKYIEPELFIVEGGVGESTKFLVSLKNKGSEIVENLGVELVISNDDSEVRMNKSISYVGLEKNREVNFLWDNEGELGTYSAELIVSYEDIVKTLSGEFEVIGPKIVLEDFYAKNLVEGVASFEIELRNIQDADLERVYAEVQVYDKHNNLVGSFETSRVNLANGEDVVLNGHINLGEFNESEYITRLSVYYGSSQIEREFETEIFNEKIEINFERSEFVKKKHSLLIKILIGLGALLIINLIWMVWHHRMKMHGKDSSKIFK